MVSDKQPLTSELSERRCSFFIRTGHCLRFYFAIMVHIDEIAIPRIAIGRTVTRRVVVTGQAIDQAAGIILFHPVCYIRYLESTPVFIKRNPHHDRGRADMLVDHHFQFVTELPAYSNGVCPVRFPQVRHVLPDQQT